MIPFIILCAICCTLIGTGSALIYYAFKKHVNLQVISLISIAIMLSIIVSGLIVHQQNNLI